jgi:hypothetical protein
MKIYLYLISFFLLNSLAKCAQPFFPTQIIFSPDNGTTIFAIDELNQRAYKSVGDGPKSSETAYALKHIKYSIPDSPE